MSYDPSPGIGLHLNHGHPRRASGVVVHDDEPGAFEGFQATIRCVPFYSKFGKVRGR